MAAVKKPIPPKTKKPLIKLPTFGKPAVAKPVAPKAGSMDDKIKKLNEEKAAAMAKGGQLKTAAKPAVKKPAVDTLAAAKKSEAMKGAAQARLDAMKAAAPKIKAHHKLTADETLSHLALKYYGHATPEYWDVIYQANKALIGANPAAVRVGMDLVIPELPATLKK
jgi:nucleoid-associated protein YgaU